MMKLGFRAVALIVLVSGAAVTLLAQPRADVERVRRQLIGSYKLISYVSYDQNGVATKLPYSAGQISYDAAGRMSAQLMRDPSAPAPATTQAPQGQPPAQGRGQGRGQGQGAGGAGGYVAYFGRYEIDAEKSIVYHHVEGSISSNMLGQAMPRYYEFSPDGATLFLQTKNGDRVTGRLQWDRYR
jgi:hypothetical protein